MIRRLTAVLDRIERTLKGEDELQYVLVPEGYIQRADGVWVNPMQHLNRDETEMLIQIVDELVAAQRGSAPPPPEREEDWIARLHQIEASATRRVLSTPS